MRWRNWGSTERYCDWFYCEKSGVIKSDLRINHVFTVAVGDTSTGCFLHSIPTCLNASTAHNIIVPTPAQSI
jgi:hypothetical protein